MRTFTSTILAGIVLAAILVLAAQPASAQFVVPNSSATFFSAESYANSATDTSDGFGRTGATTVSVSEFGAVKLWLEWNDSVAVDIYVDYYRGAGTYKGTYTDSVISTTEGKVRGIILRSRGSGTDLIPGATRFRVRLAYRSAGNGTPSKTMNGYAIKEE